MLALLHPTIKEKDWSSGRIGVKAGKGLFFSGKFRNINTGRGKQVKKTVILKSQFKEYKNEI